MSADTSDTRCLMVEYQSTQASNVISPLHPSSLNATTPLTCPVAASPSMQAYSASMLLTACMNGHRSVPLTQSHESKVSRPRRRRHERLS